MNNITIRLPAEHFDRLLANALAGSIAKKALSEVAGADSSPETRMIVCDLPTAEALQRLAAMYCTPAVLVIADAISRSQ